uniref:Uncharacterized protein n=1 Tax=Cucumis melo TaxID=3656 RepID=A0A9I9EGC6_CUCME
MYTRSCSPESNVTGQRCYQAPTMIFSNNSIFLHSCKGYVLCEVNSPNSDSGHGPKSKNQKANAKSKQFIKNKIFNSWSTRELDPLNN